MKANNIIIVPETHWDREWYLPFQEYRARLVLMMDRLLNILRTDPSYTNFTMDGQVIPIEDYLEVRPQFEDEIKQFVKEGRLSVGPMYILPDEFLISGESMVRNLLIGHKLSQKYGGVMKAGYIPDPFGHIAQLPQILSGFDIPSVLFGRGFGNEFEDLKLNMEFIWNAPGNAASIMGIHLIEGYGSVANLNMSVKEGRYFMALKTIKRVIRNLEKHTATPIVLLNSGSDHHEARPELPIIIKQWNKENPDILMEQQNFEYYVNKVMQSKAELKEFQGELRGGKYENLLSGVFSARMWIKQRNTAIEYLYEKYAEPISTLTWALDKANRYIYPDGYLFKGYTWLIKNHPHDSICGCSIDEVHEDMKTRFDWAEQIAKEIYKDGCVYLSDHVKDDVNEPQMKRLIIFNPLPWKRKDVVTFYVGTGPSDSTVYPSDLKIVDNKNNEILYQSIATEIPSRYNRQKMLQGYLLSFIDELPACGYKMYYVIPGQKSSNDIMNSDAVKITETTMENEFYKISIDTKGKISCLDKGSNIFYDNICQFEDVGDWGDEYDYSGPKETQEDKLFTTIDAKNVIISNYIDGPTQKTLKIQMELHLPEALTEDRNKRKDNLKKNTITMLVSLYKGVRRIDFSIEMKNKSKDHRIRALFPSNLIAEKVHADGHFYIVPRNVKLPEDTKWKQIPLPTNHQKDFIAVSRDSKCVGVFNKGLPEYEAIQNADGTITMAITLLRCNEWLSRFDFATRKGDAGPGLHAPGAQCLGEHLFELSFFTENNVSNLLDAKLHVRAKEFNNPIRVVAPLMVKTQFRMDDKVLVMPNIELILGSTRFSEEEKEQNLPSELSFLEIDNDKISLSIMKKSEVGNDLIIRCCNMADSTETAILKLTELIKIENSSIVNLLEDTPKNGIKAKQELMKGNRIKLTLESHVFATLRIKFTK